MEAVINKYLSLLVLAYFKDNTNYSFLYLSQILGFTITETEFYIMHLINSNQLCYVNYMLQISEQGKLFLLDNNFDCFSFSEEEILIDQIDCSKAWSMDKVYVPKNFLEKI